MGITIACGKASFTSGELEEKWTGNEGTLWADSWEELLGSKCKGPEAGAGLVCLRTSKANVATAK